MKIGTLVFNLIMSQTILGMIVNYTLGLGYSLCFVIGCILANFLAMVANDIYGDKK